MIELKNGYGIVSDGKSYTLVQDAIQKSNECDRNALAFQAGRMHNRRFG